MYQMSREPQLTGLTSEYDLKLFREAQALAAEQVVSYYYNIYIYILVSYYCNIYILVSYYYNIYSGKLLL